MLTIGMYTYEALRMYRLALEFLLNTLNPCHSGTNVYPVHLHAVVEVC